MLSYIALDGFKYNLFLHLNSSLKKKNVMVGHDQLKQFKKEILVMIYIFILFILLLL